jgi:hypothetical protein
MVQAIDVLRRAGHQPLPLYSPEAILLHDFIKRFLP